MSLLRRFTPYSLRARFLLATAAVVLVLSLSYGIVALSGYVMSINKNTYRLMRSESNLYYNLAQWNDNRLTIAQLKNVPLNFPTMVFIYNSRGNLLWQQRDVPKIRAKIKPEWLKKPDFYEIEANINTSSEALANNKDAQARLYAYNDSSSTFTHSVAVTRHEATTTLPALTIVTVDVLPQQLQQSDLVWIWFNYVLLINLLLVIPLLWLAAHWSLRPIGELASQVRELETGTRKMLNPYPPQELRSLVRNLNLLLDNERQRYTRYRNTLSDLAHSLKTPLSVLQSSLRSLRSGKNFSIEQSEPLMQDQISRISQQIGYYLHRANMQADHNPLKRELHSVSALLDSLSSALNKVYQRKGISLSLDVSPEITFVGDPNDFMEVMGNILDNACKYCLEFVEITVHQTYDALCLLVDDDGPGIPESISDLIFLRGQRADTIHPGQGLGLAVTRDILEQYNGNVLIEKSTLGGTRMRVVFHNQEIL